MLKIKLQWDKNVRTFLGKRRFSYIRVNVTILHNHSYVIKCYINVSYRDFRALDKKKVSQDFISDGRSISPDMAAV